MDAAICISYRRGSILSGISEKDTADETRVELKETLRAGHFVLSADN